MKLTKLGAGLLMLSTACRFGGPEGTPTDGIELYDGGETVIDTGSDDDDLPPPPPPDAPDPPPTEDDAGVVPSLCTPAATVAGCDPVLGTGCTPGFDQCTVDPYATEAAGRCLFSLGPLLPGCDENDFYATCPPQFTCKEGECRKYCYCDSDCGPGDTCSEPSGQGTSAAFKLCLGARP